MSNMSPFPVVTVHACGGREAVNQVHIAWCLYVVTRLQGCADPCNGVCSCNDLEAASRERAPSSCPFAARLVVHDPCRIEKLESSDLCKDCLELPHVDCRHLNKLNSAMQLNSALNLKS